MGRSWGKARGIGRIVGLGAGFVRLVRLVGRWEGGKVGRRWWRGGKGRRRRGADVLVEDAAFVGGWREGLHFCFTFGLVWAGGG